MQYRRLAVVSALLLAALSSASCASGDVETRRRPCEQTGLVIGSSGWLAGGSCDTLERRPEVFRSSGNYANPGLTPDGPWIGAIGLKNQVPGSYEYGLGLCVPNPYGGRFDEAAAITPLRSAALGVWLKFDF